MSSDAVAYAGFLAERRSQLLARVAEAARASGRDASEVEVLAVSKSVGPEEVRLAWDAGWRSFAESRPQELRRKLDALAGAGPVANASFDMIGNLQTNKVNMVLGRVRLVHSVGSLHLAQALSSHAEARQLTVRALLEVNVSGEESKGGLSPDEARRSLDALLALGGLRLEGLMTMAPKGSADAARRTFCGLRELRDELEGRAGMALPTLSCGMSDDFPIAIEEGSTLVRLGRTVFDESYATGA